MLLQVTINARALAPCGRSLCRRLTTVKRVIEGGYGAKSADLHRGAAAYRRTYRFTLDALSKATRAVVKDAATWGLGDQTKWQHEPAVPGCASRCDHLRLVVPKP